jgi:hypothetical protein
MQFQLLAPLEPGGLGGVVACVDVESPGVHSGVHCSRLQHLTGLQGGPLRLFTQPLVTLQDRMRVLPASEVAQVPEGSVPEFAGEVAPERVPPSPRFGRKSCQPLRPLHPIPGQVGAQPRSDQRIPPNSLMPAPVESGGMGRLSRSAPRTKVGPALE